MTEVNEGHPQRPPRQRSSLWSRKRPLQPADAPRRPRADEIFERGEQHRARVAAEHLTRQHVESHPVARASGAAYRGAVL